MHGCESLVAERELVRNNIKAQGVGVGGRESYAIHKHEVITTQEQERTSRQEGRGSTCIKSKGRAQCEYGGVGLRVTGEGQGFGVAPRLRRGFI